MLGTEYSGNEYARELQLPLHYAILGTLETEYEERFVYF